MSHNAANSQRPSRAEADRGAASSSAAPPPRNVASPPPGHYPRYSTGYHNAPPPALNAHSHYHQHHPPHQGGAAFSPYATPTHADGYGYGAQPYQPGRHSVEALQFARPPSRSLSQSSASGSVAATHEPVGASLYAPHYSPSYAAVNANPPVGHSARTRWAWVPIEVPQGHMADDAHLQYAPYPTNFYTPPAAPVTHTPPSSHSPYQPAYSESPVQATPAYGVPATPPSYTPSYPYHPHPAHYMPPPAHNSHPHVAAPGRASRSGTQQVGPPPAGAKGDGAAGGGSRRQSNQSGRSGSAHRRPSSNSSGNHSSSQPVSTSQRVPAPPLDPRSVVHAPQSRSSQPSDFAEEDPQSVEEAANVVGVSGLASEAEADLDSMFDAPVDSSAAERVPGSGLRPHYHPQQGPRSEWVLWCGNVPQDATVEELWEVFSRLTPHEYRRWLALPEGQEHAAELTSTDDDIEEHGVLSIFIISRSNCAFINYASLPHLDRAVKYFHGKQVRPLDARCPKLVCRVRKKDDEAQAGVAGQRGRGIHVAWLKQQRELERANDAANGEPVSKESPFQPSPIEPLSPPPPRDAPPQVAAGLTSAASYSSSGSASYASTNSSLFRHPAFRHRFFILKSLRTDDLDRSIETGYWATQPHNEAVLDQAYRNSEAVYLIFGVNQTGQFHGYARMAGPIFTPTNENKEKDEQRRRASLSSVLSAASNGLPPTTIPESVEENAIEAEPSQSDVDGISADGSGLRQPHPTLEKRDIEAARGLFGTLSVDAGGDASVPMTSPLPITPSVEEAAFGKGILPQRQDTITPQTADTSAHSSTWPYTSRKNSSGGNSAEASASERLRLASAPLTDGPAVCVMAEPDEYGVRRMDMEAESAHTNSSQSDQPSLGPSDSASWSSADPRMAEQIALRAVIHNLRLDEKESRGQAEMLESQLRSSSANTDTTVTAKGSDVESGSGEAVRIPPRQSSSDSWGKPFRVEWIRTDPLPFQRVKKLRNPWRDNRQVKVSRDGTELEPGVGRQLLEEWNRLHPAVPAPVDSTKASNKRVDAASSAGRPPSDEDE